MNLVDKKVIHEVFGKGNVVDCDDSYIKINFESGDKRFVFPDVFKDYIKFTDKKASELVEEKIKIKTKELEKQALIEKKERALEQERLYNLEQKRQIKSRKTHTKLQSVFWVKPEEEKQVFEDWQIFTGRIKSGKKEGLPRKFPRMNQNSGCLLTKRKDDEPEEDRQIIGVFMVEESFNGRKCEDGYIKAHLEYRIHLTKEESDKMLFWDYYYDKKFPEKTIWNSGRQRYFDNIWMAQILSSIVTLREKTDKAKEAENFLEYFCRLNQINKEELLEPNGPLLRT